MIRVQVIRHIVIVQRTPRAPTHDYSKSQSRFRWNTRNARGREIKFNLSYFNISPLR